MHPQVRQIIDTGSFEDRRGLFAFTPETRIDIVLNKFDIWSKLFQPDYFLDAQRNPIASAPFHRTMLQGYLKVYKGLEPEFLNIAGRGLAKTALAKLFMAFCIANDTSRFRKFYKILCKEADNARQISTDIYNILVSTKHLYPEIFEKTETKREERMESFTTATGIKLTADTVGTGQRGDIQEYARPDYIYADDFEDEGSLMSASTTHRIWLNMNEARTGLAKGGGMVYACNYISERGNVHKLNQIVTHKLITPIATKGTDGKWIPTWNRFTSEDIKILEKRERNFEGEYLCKPSASFDVWFDRDSVNRQVAKSVIDEVSGLKIFKEYNPMHRIAGGHDVGGGVGLDHSTSVFIDFDHLPIQVIATYKNNEIRPDEFGYEIAKQGKKFGECLLAPERNYGSTLDFLKTIYPTDKIYKVTKPGSSFQVPKVDYGWLTTGGPGGTKTKMLIDLSQAIENGQIELNDPDLIDEARSYTRDDLMDKEVDPRIATRHFDLLMACAIAFQMGTHARKPEVKPAYDYWMPDNPALKVIGRTIVEESDNPAI